MRRFSPALFLFALACHFSSSAQTSQLAPEVRSFELTATPPPVPALKYELQFDVLADRLPGNAAPLYLDAVLIMPTDAREKAQKALEAYERKDFKAFEKLADELDKPALFQELDLAGRRDHCDWEPPFREMGAETLLPHLEPLIHGVGRWIRVRALRQIEQGKPDDAVATLRLGYELAQKVGGEPVLVSGLVSVAITRQMNETLMRLMDRPDSPNLYWALLNHPGGRTVYRQALYGERRFLVAGWPDLAKAVAGEDLAPAQWQTTMSRMSSLRDSPDNKRPTADPVKDATPENLRQAREQYAESKHVSAEQAARAESIVVLGRFYVHQAELLVDDVFKLRGLPYPLLLVKSGEMNDRMAKLKGEQPGNPFIPVLNLQTAARRFAELDRQLAALTTVEALRSYAAVHGRKLPARLEDIEETPAPQNPMTGKAFEYRIENDAATIADSQSQPTLTYTVKIRG
jgi:hypothetical protein